MVKFQSLGKKPCSGNQQHVPDGIGNVSKECVPDFVSQRSLSVNKK